MTADVGELGVLGIRPHGVMIDADHLLSLDLVRGEGVIGHLRLGVEEAHHVVLAQIHAVDRHQRELEHLDHGPVLRPAEDTAEGEGERRLLLRLEEATQGESGGDRIRVGVVVGADEHPLALLDDIEQDLHSLPDRQLLVQDRHELTRQKPKVDHPPRTGTLSIPQCAPARIESVALIPRSFRKLEDELPFADHAHVVPGDAFDRQRIAPEGLHLA